jgi:hypothetical protein
MTSETCKYCYESHGILEHPCKCSDGVHEECLDRWRVTDHASETICEVCQELYTRELVVSLDDTMILLDINLNNMMIYAHMMYFAFGLLVILSTEPKVAPTANLPNDMHFLQYFRHKMISYYEKHLVNFFYQVRS